MAVKQNCSIFVSLLVFSPSQLLVYESMKAIRKILAIVLLATTTSTFAADPQATSYTFEQCEGSLTPYPTEISPVEYPDSLIPVFINHVGRHGSRYPASSANCLILRRALQHADSIGTITPLGRELMALNDKVIAESNNRWGALDSLGMAEQVGIASRMVFNFPEVFGDGSSVSAISSYSPRAMMSMYSFVHQLDRLNNRITYTTSSGRVNSPLVRPFDTDAEYQTFRNDRPWAAAYDEYFTETATTSALARVLGTNYTYATEADARNLAITEYYVLAGLSAMGMPSQMSKYFTNEEANALWSCFNLRQYLQRTATTISAVPADIAADLVLDIIKTTDEYISGENTQVSARLRFGHGETIMPLVSLLRLPGCYYRTNYFDTVAKHWCDFNVVPMAANVQFIIFQGRKSGKYYVRVDLNERPVALRNGDDSIYYPWGELRRYMMNCLPLIKQL